MVLAVASTAKGHLDEARALAPQLPRGAASMLLPSVGAGRYLEALQTANFDPFDSGIQARGGVQGVSVMHVLSVKYHLLMGTF